LYSYVNVQHLKISVLAKDGCTRMRLDALHPLAGGPSPAALFVEKAPKSAYM
jgi:hypothetical protein